MSSSIALAGMALVSGCSDAGMAGGDEVASVGSTQQAATLSMLGAGVSSVQRTLDLGGSHYGADGSYARLRIINPNVLWRP